MATKPSIDTSRITAYRAYTFEREHANVRGWAVYEHVYEIQFDGEVVGHYCARDLPQARGLARKALIEAHESRWNQALIVDGSLPECDVSAVSLRRAVERVFTAARNFA